MFLPDIKNPSSYSITFGDRPELMSISMEGNDDTPCAKPDGGQRKYDKIL